MNSSAPTALVAAAPTLFRQGLLALFRERWPQVRLSLTADTAEAAELAARHAFGLVVLDGTGPDLNLPVLLDQLHRARPTQRLLVLADPRHASLSGAALGGSDTRLLVPSHVPPHALAEALAPWLDARPARPAGSYFSPRELQVLRLVVADHCNEEIAHRLFINVRTVESHRRALIQKAGTRTLVGLAARAVREGWVA